MSFWNRIIESVGGNISKGVSREVSRDASRYAVVDCEVGMRDKKIHDIGALRADGMVFHSADKSAMMGFLDGVDYVCYDISDSLENYVQEAGRAGRDPHLEARCFVLYEEYPYCLHV